MRVEADSIEEYFHKAGAKEPVMRALDEVIRGAAPELKRVLFGGVSGKGIGYGMQPYQTKSMKGPAEWPLIGLAIQKHHIGLYVCAVENGKYIAEENADRLGNVSVGRSCIRIKKIEDLNLDVVREIITDIAKRVNSGEKLFGI
jgi:hypothetical protein